MKIAVFFSGRITGWQMCRESLWHKFMKLYDVDVFISLDMTTPSADVAEFKSEYNVIGEYYEKYNKTLKQNPPYRTEETTERKTLSMFYHNFMAMNLILEHMKKTGTTYDVVVKFRADVSCNELFNIPQHIIPNTIYIPNGNNYRGINDQIAFGPMLPMTIYCSLYNHIPKYVYVEQAIFNPEFLLMFHINHNNINIMRFVYRYNLHPARFDDKNSNNESEYMSVLNRVPIDDVEKQHVD